jgi:hypothetical protein
MAEMETLFQHLAPLRAIHEQIRGTCRSLGLDVDTAIAYASDTNRDNPGRHLLLPWDQLAAPVRCLQTTAKLLTKSISQDPAQISAYLAGSDLTTLHTGFVGCLTAGMNRFLDNPQKVALIEFLQRRSGSSQWAEDLKSLHFGNRPQENLMAPSHGVLSWLVNDLLTVKEIRNVGLRDETMKLLDVLSKHTVLAVAHTAREAMAAGDSEFPSLAEQVLIEIGRRKLLAPAVVSEIFTEFNKTYNSILKDERNSSSVVFLGKLENLYPSPSVSALEGFGQQAFSPGLRTKWERTEIWRSLSALLEDKLTSQPEWRDPISSAIEILSDIPLGRVWFRDGILKQQKAHNILLEILSKTDCDVRIRVDLLCKLGPTVSSKQAAAGINRFIVTGKQKDLDAALENDVSSEDKAELETLLTNLIGKVGRNRIKIITKSEEEELILSNQQRALVITNEYSLGAAHVDIYTKKMMPESKHLARMQKYKKLFNFPNVGLPVIYASIRDVILPTLGAKSGVTDQLGLNGFKTKVIAECLSGKQIANFVMLPELDSSSFSSLPLLTIMYNGREEGRKSVE